MRRASLATKCDCDGAIFKSSSQNSEKCGIQLNNFSGLFLSISDEVSNLMRLKSRLKKQKKEAREQKIGFVRSNLAEI